MQANSINSYDQDEYKRFGDEKGQPVRGNSSDEAETLGPLKKWQENDTEMHCLEQE